MEENQLFNQVELVENSEPTYNVDNSENSQTVISKEQNNEGQATNAPSNLILGKFKSVEDLSKAYSELEKQQGVRSEELGNLRQNSAILQNISEAWKRENEIKNSENNLKEVVEKYNTPEYFQDNAFRQIYKEAFMALGNKLDTDRFINLLEGYVSSRVFALEKSKAINSENTKAIDSMGFERNSQTSFSAPKKRLDEMSSKEIDELLDKLI